MKGKWRKIKDLEGPEGEFPERSGAFPQPSGEFPQRSRELPRASRDVPQRSREVPLASGEFPLASGELREGPGEFREGSGEFPEASGEAREGSGGVRERSGEAAERRTEFARRTMRSATPGLVFSRAGDAVIAVEEIEDVALPLYQGVTVQQFDFAPKSWIRGTGLLAKWEEIPWEDKHLSPQFLLSASDLKEGTKSNRDFKPVTRRVARNTDARTMICCLVPGMPCGDKASVVMPGRPSMNLLLPAFLNSFTFDQLARTRAGGTQVDWHILSESVSGHPDPARLEDLGLAVLQLNGAHELFSTAWQDLLRWLAPAPRASLLRTPWRKLWAVTPHERLRLRCMLDAAVAHLYGLDAEDFGWILRDCDHPVAWVTNKANARTLDPKGFWRVDKHAEPELRHPVLAQAAFADLRRAREEHGEEEGLRRFLGTGPDDGWRIPERLRLADLGLGRDARARESVEVAGRLGPRFHEWQLAQGAKESWAECRMHAEKIRRIREAGRKGGGEGTGERAGSRTGKKETGKKADAGRDPREDSGNGRPAGADDLFGGGSE